MVDSAQRKALRAQLALMASIATVLQGIPIFVMSIRDWDLIQGKASTGF